MRIGIDLDGVLGDFIGSFFEVSRRVVGKPEVGISTSTSWDFKDIMTKEEVSKTWEAVKNTRNFWLNLKREKGVTSQNLRRMAKTNDLVFITARAQTKGYSVQQQSAAWLALEFALKWPTVIEEDNKGPLAAALHLDYFIDDRPENCLEIQSTVPKCKVYLKSLPHNADFKAWKGITRVETFNEFATIVLGETK